MGFAAWQQSLPATAGDPYRMELDVRCKWAMQDARTAIAYGPREEEQSTWPHAHAAHSMALEGLKVVMYQTVSRLIMHTSVQPLWALTDTK